MFGFLESAVEGVKSAGKSVGEWLSPSAHAVADTVATTGHVIGDLGAGIQDEGLAGLLDPMGMIDRQDAKRDLADNFEIMPDDFVGPRNHNQISQAEFDQVAHTFSDIRLGRGDLTIDSHRLASNPEGEGLYRDAVMEDISQMMMTTSGRRQVENLHDTPDDHLTTIEAMSSNGVLPPLNAAVANGRVERWSDVETNIFYDPGAEMSDITLAHEMEHARGEAYGTKAEGIFYPEDSHFDKGEKNEERKTVGLTLADGVPGYDPVGAPENLYRHERNQVAGEHWEPRMEYAIYPGQQHDEKKLDALWTEFMGSPEDAVFR